MNQQIKTLIEQATTEESDGFKYFDKEKFAELIVRECAKVNNQFLGHRIGEIDLDLVYKEHFGVEE